ncbi:hypothetical protein PM082_003036 [Marasmius tenuissimus]|nr:hypothetical protein PM082_003036 [Marasmius tenuissimus]
MLLLKSIFHLSLFLLVKAHFKLQFPSPRGAFNEENEPNFYGYTTPATNRTTISMTDSYIALLSEHTNWVVAVLLANSTNPTSFDNFTQITSFTRNTGEGTFCMPFSLAKSNATGLDLKTGQNVTLQIEFAGDDGSLFQCADVTLSNSTTDSTPTSGCTAGNLQETDGTASNGTGASGGNNGTEAMTVTTAIPGIAVALALISLLLAI